MNHAKRKLENIRNYTLNARDEQYAIVLLDVMAHLSDGETFGCTRASELTRMHKTTIQPALKRGREWGVLGHNRGKYRFYSNSEYAMLHAGYGFFQ